MKGEEPGIHKLVQASQAKSGNMKPVLVFGTAGTQMLPSMAILIRWMPSSWHRMCRGSSCPACVPGQQAALAW